MNCGKVDSLYFVPVVVCAAALLQFGHAAYTAERSKSSGLLSLVGETMSSTNDVPFDWSSDYEVAVVYITSMWSELISGDPEHSTLQGIIAKNGYLSYCVRFKMQLAAWAQSLQGKHYVSKAVKNAASNWYRAVDTLSHDNWQLPKTLDLESFKKQFMTTYKHLVLNGGEIYEEAVNERTRRDVDGFTRRIANVLIETLRNITNRCRSIPKTYYGTGNNENPISVY
ncbi:uncharacterized protein LOC112694084 [Sipha flava]|uniref:Uncharacterized protein LOC112694084 n=1 Tax=Sipha flava TaxID=143950 RepID=A0A2S2Q9C5_9HEMI|nr:uncharacterized protein LOC112694084 [Sipha flava]